ncbi:hypothetical protein BGZ95_010252 [Linnemannia exigua]|uniref:Uncharacterized protein n=1 Tax=Linnemannia exigua TaxID=604196 RepID=A0AAD4DC81_9FUNG|nr:hypothetical protein BGZ95_010252 [Linnemannia exigua]
MASHLYNLRDTEKTHHYDLRESTVSATKTQMLHSDPQQQHATNTTTGAAHARGQGHEHRQKQSHHTQKSHTDKQRDHPAAVKLATGTEANLEHAVNPEHDPSHPGH